MKDIQRSKEDIEHDYYRDLWADMCNRLPISNITMADRCTGLYTFSVGLSKFVILGFYWRMFSHSTIRWPIRMLLAMSAAWIITRVRLI
jgi:hypothetical protein